MPSGRTHDAITILLTVPAAAAAFAVTQGPVSAAVVAAAFLFGGVMFGPDLDTHSKQHGRWHFLGFLWVPYRYFFAHRSRFTHGLVFGAVLRVVYFLGALTVGIYVSTLVWKSAAGGEMPDLRSFALAWRAIGDWIRTHCPENFLVLAFAGLWAGAASHTITDISWSFIKTGRVGKFL